VNPSDLGLAPGTASAYAATTAGDYIMGRINASQKHRQADEAAATAP
jgi:hypothetical protein